MAASCFIISTSGSCLVSCNMDKNNSSITGPAGGTAICNLAASMHQLAVDGDDTEYTIQFRRATFGQYAVQSVCGAVDVSKQEDSEQFIVLLVVDLGEIGKNEFLGDTYVLLKLFCLGVHRRFAVSHAAQLENVLSMDRLRSSSFEYDFQSATAQPHTSNNCTLDMFRRFEDLELKRMLRSAPTGPPAEWWLPCSSILSGSNMKLHWVGCIFAIPNTAQMFTWIVPAPSHCRSEFERAIEDTLNSVIRSQTTKIPSQDSHTGRMPTEVGSDESCTKRKQEKVRDTELTDNSLQDEVATKLATVKSLMETYSPSLHSKVHLLARSCQEVSHSQGSGKLTQFKQHSAYLVTGSARSSSIVQIQVTVFGSISAAVIPAQHQTRLELNWDDIFDSDRLNTPQQSAFHILERIESLWIRAKRAV